MGPQQASQEKLEGREGGEKADQHYEGGKERTREEGFDVWQCAKPFTHCILLFCAVGIAYPHFINEALKLGEVR